MHDVTIFSDWTIELTGDADQLIGKATTDILMSEFGMGPISIVGLLKTEDGMQLTLDFVALAAGASLPIMATSTATEQPITGDTDLTFSHIRPILETNSGPRLRRNKKEGFGFPRASFVEFGQNNEPSVTSFPRVVAWNGSTLWETARTCV